LLEEKKINVDLRNRELEESDVPFILEHRTEMLWHIKLIELLESIGASVNTYEVMGLYMHRQSVTYRMEKQYLEERGFVLPGSVLITEMDGALKYILATVASPAEWIKTGLCEGVKVLKKLRKRPDLKKKRVGIG
jgi:hypothetical protein